MVNPKRLHTLKDEPRGTGPVVYLMSRDQRFADNWALLAAAEDAAAHSAELLILFVIYDGFLGATPKQFDFMLEGISQLQTIAETRSLPFVVRKGDTVSIVREYNPSILYTDFSPLRVSRALKQRLVDELAIPVIEVDAHNIVPVWEASPKREWAAYTIRPKITRLLPEFLTDFPELPAVPPAHYPSDDFTFSEDAYPEFRPGVAEASKRAQQFLRTGLASYEESRNDPLAEAQSDLSPYLHFGQISAQRIALIAQSLPNSDSFFEELVIRRELADNFCFYEPNYDSVECFPAWATETLGKHSADERTLYSKSQLEAGETADSLWNACQHQLTRTGKLHGYLRMYWAKQLLLWTPSASVALEIGIFLNDTYSLDGRDPNGYAGLAWSIGGVHDRPWFDRPIIGTVRPMTRGGCDKKFDTKRYIEQYT